MLTGLRVDTIVRPTHTSQGLRVAFGVQGSGLGLWGFAWLAPLQTEVEMRLGVETERYSKEGSPLTSVTDG